MTSTLHPTTTTGAAEPPVAPWPTGPATAADRPATGTRRAAWPVFGAVGAVAAFASSVVSMPSLTEEDYASGVDVIDQLDRGGYHAGFLLGLVSIGCLLMAAQGWKRWAEDRAPRDLAARTLATGLGVTATVNITFTGLMGSLALYLPGGPDEGWLSRDAIFTNFTLLDFGSLLGWWGAAASAVAMACLAFRRERILPRWMGVASVLLLLPAVGMAIGMALPGMVGFTMPIWLAVVSVGMVFSKRAHAAA